MVMRWPPQPRCSFKCVCCPVPISVNTFGLPILVPFRRMLVNQTTQFVPLLSLRKVILVCSIWGRFVRKFLDAKVLLDVRAAEIYNPISGLWGVVDDLEGLRAFAEQSRDLGYQGLMAIHPSHLPVINEVFTPSSSEIREWQQVIEAMEEAEREGRGAIRLSGRLIDFAHVATARRNLEFARDLGLETAG